MKTTQTLAVLSLMLASCGPAFDGPDRVEDLRVLAVAAEPSEIIYPGAAPTEAVADITFLVADPALPLASLSWTLTGCVVQEDGRCTSSSQVLLGEGAGLPGEHTVRVTLPEALIRESFEADVYLGIFGAAVWVQGIVTQVGGQEVRFLKSVVLAPDYGLGRVPNANPALEAILRGEEDAEEPLELDADGAWHVPAGEKIRLLPVAPEEARETYVVPAFEFEGELDPAALAAGELPDVTFTSEELEEELVFRFYTSLGSMSVPSKAEGINVLLEGDEDREERDLSVVLRAPEEPGRGTLWFTVDDERGGVGWLVVPLVVE